MTNDAAQPTLPDEIRRACILPEEQIVFASADAIAWAAIHYRASQAKLDQAFLMGSFGPGGQGGLPGGGAAMETIAMTPRPRQWKANNIDWVVLTDQRLLFISRGVPERVFELAPSHIKEWIVAERDALNKATQEFKEAWKKRGVLGIFGGTKSDGAEATIPPTLYTVNAVDKHWHLFRRKRSLIGFLIFFGGVVVLWQLIAHGVPAGIWLIVAFVAIIVAARVGPWTGVRLRVAFLQYGTPKLVRRLSGWMLSREEIQLRTRDDADHLVSLLAPCVRAVSEVMASQVQ